MKRILFQNMLVVLAALSIGLAIVEGLLRAFALAPQVVLITSKASNTAYVQSADPILGYELQPNFRSANVSNQFGSFSYVNADGRRDIERVVSRVSGVSRVLLVGDSVVAGHCEAEIDRMISRQLEMKLGKNYEVLNFGVGGYNSLAEAQLVRLRGLKYQPDAIIVVVVDNDDDDHNTDMDVYKIIRPEWSERLFLHSDLFRLLALRTNLFRLAESVRGAFVDEHRKIMGSHVLEQGMSQFAALSKEYNFKVGVVVWPRFSDQAVTEERHPKIVSGDGLKIERLSQQHQFKFLRLKPIFDADLKNACQQPNPDANCQNPRLLYTSGDTIHPSFRASQLTAEALVSFTRELLR